MTHTVIVKSTGHRIHHAADGSFIRTGTTLSDGAHIAVASGPKGPAQAFEARSAEAARAQAEQAAGWRAA